MARRGLSGGSDKRPNFAAALRTYTGESADTKPESLAEQLSEPLNVPGFAEIADRLAEFIRGENDDAEHCIDDLCDGGRRLSPAVAMREWVTSERRPVDPAAYDLFLNQWAREVRVGRNGIAIAIGGVKISYGQFEPMLTPYKAARRADREPLRVAYDPDNLREIKVYRADWSFLCTAPMNGIGGRIAGVVAGDVKTMIAKQRSYNRARRDVNNLAITQILTNEEQIAAVAHERINPPPSIRPIRTPLDGQSKAVQRERLRKAAGAESLTPDEIGISAGDLLGHYSAGTRQHHLEMTPDLLAQLREQNHEW